MGTLNKSRPYGTVYGIPGVAFDQDGRSYNSLGQEMLVDCNGDVMLAPVTEPVIITIPVEEQAPSPSPERVENLSTLTKAEIISGLVEAGVEFNPTGSRIALLKLLKATKKG